MIINDGRNHFFIPSKSTLQSFHPLEKKKNGTAKRQKTENPKSSWESLKLPPTQALLTGGGRVALTGVVLKFK